MNLKISVPVHTVLYPFFSFLIDTRAGQMSRVEDRMRAELDGLVDEEEPVVAAATTAVSDMIHRMEWRARHRAIRKGKVRYATLTKEEALDRELVMAARQRWDHTLGKIASTPETAAAHARAALIETRASYLPLKRDTALIGAAARQREDPWHFSVQQAFVQEVSAEVATTHALLEQHHEEMLDLAFNTALNAFPGSVTQPLGRPAYPTTSASAAAAAAGGATGAVALGGIWDLFRRAPPPAPAPPPLLTGPGPAVPMREGYVSPSVTDTERQFPGSTAECQDVVQILGTSRLPPRDGVDKNPGASLRSALPREDIQRTIDDLKKEYAAAMGGAPNVSDFDVTQNQRNPNPRQNVDAAVSDVVVDLIKRLPKGGDYRQSVPYVQRLPGRLDHDVQHFPFRLLRRLALLQSGLDNGKNVAALTYYVYQMGRFINDLRAVQHEDDRLWVQLIAGLADAGERQMVTALARHHRWRGGVQFVANLLVEEVRERHVYALPPAAASISCFLTPM